MRQASLVNDVAHALHMDPTVRSRVGDRVHSTRTSAELPDIVISEIASGDTRKGFGIRVTCRAKTPDEARRIGAAVKMALSRDTAADGFRWVAVQDTSNYDSSAGAFRRVISVETRA